MVSPFPYITAGYGLYQTINADAELKKLENEPIPEYKATAQSRALIDMGEYGYSPKEIAAFHDQLNQSENAAYRQTL